MTRLEKAFALFDAYNRQDPHQITEGGTTYPAEYFYAQQLHHWVTTLYPEAGEALLLASRCQHIGRWEIPREKYPEGKAGYLRWRQALSVLHAQKAGELLAEAGYTSEEIEPVQAIVRKSHLHQNPDSQAMENALCLVFFAYQYEDFRQGQSDDTVVRILKKTWKKMSEPGRAAALKLSYSEKGKALLDEALQG
jgi:hypothetical protein